MPESRSAAVRNGLRAYQLARGLTVDGRMDPGGATEQALHRQIGVQQRRLKGQLRKDAAEAAATLSAGGSSGNAGAPGGPESVAARTLGARITGAKVEAQQREAYAETRDRMKRAVASADTGAAAGKGAQPGRSDGNAAKHRPRGGHPLIGKQPAHIAQRAEAREAAEAQKHAGLGDIEHETDRRERQQAADAAFRSGAQPGPDRIGRMLRGVG